jgi:hypothetical protein
MNLSQGMSFVSKIIHNMKGFIGKERYFTGLDTILFEFGKCLFYTPALLDMVLYEVLRASEVFRVSLVKLGLQPYIHKEFDSCFLLYFGLFDYVLFSFSNSVPICLKYNIVNHISAKHQLTRCCL